MIDEELRIAIEALEEIRDLKREPYQEREPYYIAVEALFAISRERLITPPDPRRQS